MSTLLPKLLLSIWGTLFFLSLLPSQSWGYITPRLSAHHPYHTTVHKYSRKLYRPSTTHLFVSSSSSTQILPGTAALDKPWEQLGFEFRQTKSNVRIVYKNGSWGEIQLVEVCIQ